jgi:hypothetical protein
MVVRVSCTFDTLIGVTGQLVVRLVHEWMEVVMAAGCSKTIIFKQFPEVSGLHTIVCSLVTLESVSLGVFVADGLHFGEGSFEVFREIGTDSKKLQTHFILFGSGCRVKSQ